MTQFKTILMTAAFLAAPSIALAQIPTGAVTDVVKDKAISGVMDNLTTDDKITAGKTLLKGGSKEDAAMAVVKGRVNDKVDGLTGGLSTDDLSKDGLIDAGKAMAVDKAKGSASTYTDGVPSVGGLSTSDLSTGSAIDAGKAIAMEKAKSSATNYGDKAAGSASTYGSAVIPKSGVTTSAPTVTTPAAAPVSCPAGTKDAGNGTCMVTGNWKF